MVHRLQTEFAPETGEARYVERLRKLVAGGYLDAAEGILITDLASLGTDFAAQCAALRREDVELSGWAELIDAKAGRAITCLRGCSPGSRARPSGRPR